MPIENENVESVIQNNFEICGICHRINQCLGLYLHLRKRRYNVTPSVKRNTPSCYRISWILKNQKYTTLIDLTFSACPKISKSRSVICILMVNHQLLAQWKSNQQVSTDKQKALTQKNDKRWPRPGQVKRMIARGLEASLVLYPYLNS